jgi:hypothetical protein
MRVKKIFFVLTIILTSLPALPQDALPGSVYFKTMSEGFSHANLYALRDGKLWFRENGRIESPGSEWKLFGGTGLPGGANAASFGADDRIAQFSTEATMIAAASEKGRVYLWQPTLGAETAWSDVTGSPFEDALYLPPNRCWTFSLSLARAPWKRLTPMPEEDIVSYWEDADGNRTEFGFTATIYAVDPDGQRIRYTDTGLPTSWHKAFASPERGAFVIEHISAAASAVFVMNGKGKMYTRILDYETEGGCPALIFVYDHAKRNGDKAMPLMESVRTIPLPGWTEQPPIPDALSGEALIAGKITILLTGKGNDARELRVQGRSRGGAYGYWMKPIAGKEWRFIETGERFPDSEIIDYDPGSPSCGKTRDGDYRGTLKRWWNDPLQVELVNFYYYDSPCTLRVHTVDTSFDLIFHTVDMWSPTAQKKFNPDLVGNPDGEPKLLQGTIEVPDALLNSDNPEIRRVIDRYFRDFNKIPFAFKVWADDRKVSVTSRFIQRNLLLDRDYETRTPMEMEFIKGAYTPGPGIFSRISDDPELAAPRDGEITDPEREIAVIDRKMTMNREAIKTVNRLLSDLHAENLKAGTVSLFGYSAFTVFNGAVSIIQLPHWNITSTDPATRENIIQLGGVSYTGGTPMIEYAKMNLAMTSKIPDDCKRAIAVLNSNIEKLGKMKKELEEKTRRYK